MQDGGWIGLASLVVTGVLGVLTLWINRRYDQKTAALESQNAGQAAQISALIANGRECHEEHEKTAEKLEKCEEKHQTTELRIDRLEQRLEAKKDRTDEHRTL